MAMFVSGSRPLPGGLEYTVPPTMVVAAWLRALEGMCSSTEFAELRLCPGDSEQKRKQSLKQLCINMKWTSSLEKSLFMVVNLKELRTWFVCNVGATTWVKMIVR